MTTTTVTAVTAVDELVGELWDEWRRAASCGIHGPRRAGIPAGWPGSTSLIADGWVVGKTLTEDRYRVRREIAGTEVGGSTSAYEREFHVGAGLCAALM